MYIFWWVWTYSYICQAITTVNVIDTFITSTEPGKDMEIGLFLGAMNSSAEGVELKESLTAFLNQPLWRHIRYIEISPFIVDMQGIFVYQLYNYSIKLLKKRLVGFSWWRRGHAKQTHAHESHTLRLWDVFWNWYCFWG